MTTLDNERRIAARKALLENRLRGAQANGVPAVPPSVQRRRGSEAGVHYAPLSAAQLQLWYLNRLAPKALAYNELAIVTKDGAFDVAALGWAFNEFIRRHEAWRTTFAVVGDEPRQVIHPPTVIDLPVLDVSHLPFDEAVGVATDLAVEQTRQPYDMSAGPLIRPQLVRVSPSCHRLYLGLHHLIFDGVTLYRIFLPELVSLYNSRIAGALPALTEPPVQHGDYSSWERKWVEGDEVANRVECYRRHFEGAPALDLPLDRPRPPRPRFAGSVEPISVDADTVARLRTSAGQQGATLFHALAAVYAYWLHCYTGSSDVTFATPTDLRQRSELESMVGYCLTPTVLRARLCTEWTFAEAVGAMRTEVLDALGRVVPFERLVRGLDVPRDPRMNPLFQSVLVLEPPTVPVDDEWSMQLMENAVGAGVGQVKFDLSLELDERADGRLVGRISYNTDLFESGTIALMGRHLNLLLRRCAEDPTAVLSELSLADFEDVARQLNLNPAAVESRPIGLNPPDTIHEAIVNRATKTPNAPAVTVGENCLTYAELVNRARSIAEHLTWVGIGPGTVVAVLMPRTIDLVPAILAVLMVGAAYLPIEPRQPVRRARFMLDDADAAVVLTAESLAQELTWVDCPVVTVDGKELSDRSAERVADAHCAVRPEDLAYIIYTSGSTGSPKGVQVEHRNVLDLMESLPAAVDLASDDVVLSVASYTFDMSVGDYFVTLGAGAGLVVATTEEMHDPRRLAYVIEQCGATRMSATPTSWAALIESGWPGRSGLIAGAVGEPLPQSVATSLSSLCAGVWNGWGPTETTVFAGGGAVSPDEPVTVGRPMPGTRLYVTDSRGRILPMGVPGEIVIGGPGVSRGYLHRTSETAQRFGPDPYVPGERVYRSGDRGRYIADGRLRHLGRLDDQVKIRGFRIELGEIEATLREHPGVATVSVDVGTDHRGQPQLVAYIVPAARYNNQPGPDGDANLRAWTRQRLPEYMVPAEIIRVPTLPTSASGKLDRRALRDLAARALSDAGEHRSAAITFERVLTPTEQKVASLWSMLLAIEVSDLDRNFFDLGGHSILAANLVAQIEHRMGAQVSLVDFLDKGTTVAGLARLVDDASSPAELQPAPELVTDRRPAFFVFPDLPSAMSLRHLRALWGDEQSVHPLLPLAASMRPQRWETVEELVEPTMSALRAVQPEGPYALAGFSFGGLVAYELARQLDRDGQQVTWLGILDTPTPETAGRVMKRWKSSSGRLERLRQPGRIKLVADYARNLGWAGREKLIAAGLVRRSATEDFDLRGVWDIMARYEQRGHSVPLELFVTSSTAAEVRTPVLGWDTFHEGRLRTHFLCGSHDSILDSPQIEELAAIMLAGLHDARVDLP
ncbi:amino acid adenylation domain-containing protein [Rhodococcus sp. NPDC056743]|uniref:non-ribosomal peptide synthetase n=1 Tax=Rhodococcus sp. NPDC056743 TaxID=3345934 RepID=UPI00366C0687